MQTKLIPRSPKKAQSIPILSKSINPFHTASHGPHFSSQQIKTSFISPKFHKVSTQPKLQQARSDIALNQIEYEPMKSLPLELFDVEEAYYDLPDDIIRQFESIAKLKDAIRKAMPILKEKRPILHLDGLILALDLDETLIHTVTGSNPKESDSINLGGEFSNFWIIKRPYLELFFQTMSQYFNLVIFTSSDRKYASEILSMLDPSSKYKISLVCRDCCTLINNEVLIKNLFTLTNDLSKVLLVDNSILSFSAQMENGIYIKPFMGERYDNELMEVAKQLLEYGENKSFASYSSPLPKLLEYHNKVLM